MKRTISLLLALAMLLGLCACGAEKNVTGTDVTATDAAESESGQGSTIRKEKAGNVVVVYFSHNDVIRTAAEFAAGTRDFDLIELTPKKAYPDDEAELAKRVKEEKEKGARPALEGLPKDLDSYDVIFLGFPVWEGTIPMAVGSFLESYDMVDKAIVPFCCASDGQADESLNDIASLCPYSVIVSAYLIPDGDFADSEPIFEGWMDQILFG